jgi:hypothetical protein
MRHIHAGDGQLGHVTVQGLKHDMVRLAEAVRKRQDSWPVQLPQTAPRTALHQARVARALGNFAAVRDRFAELEAPNSEENLECGPELGQFA